MRQIVVGAGVINKSGQILMAQRMPDDSEGGKWEFPGGKVEWGEDPRQSLCRELNEELGVSVEVGEMLDAVSVVKGPIHLILLYYSCKIIKGEPNAIECQQVSWWYPEEIGILSKPPADEEFWVNYSGR